LPLTCRPWEGRVVSLEVSIDAVRSAATELRPHLHRTPLVRSAYLSERIGAEIHLKLENQQRTGSFKVRGALLQMLHLGAAERAAGVITISAGNHAQAVAWAARSLGLAATVVMPAAASPAKVAAARGYGAEVVLHGDVEAAFVRLDELRHERSLTFIHPFDAPGAVIGQATLGLEIVEDLPDVDLVVVGIGGGGLASGVAFAVTELRSEATVVGVEPEGALAMHLSRAAGHPVRLEAMTTIADGLAPPFVGELPFQIAEQRIAELAQVDDAAIVAAMRVLLERVKTLAEPAGAAATAALLSGAVEPAPGSRVACIVSGGNIGAGELAQLLLA